MSFLTVIILAGGSLAGRKIGPSEPLHSDPRWLPAGMRLAVDHISDFYTSNAKPPELLLVHDSNALESPNLPKHACNSLKQLAISPQLSIGDTIAKVLPFIETKWILINPITTLPVLHAKEHTSIQIGDRLLQQEDWSSLYQNINGVWSPLPKKHADPFKMPSWPFTGIVTTTRDGMQELLNGCSAASRYDLLEIASPLLKNKDCEIIKVPWRDLGHLATYAISMRNKINSRSFNSVRYCSSEGTIIKQSTDSQRLSDEKVYLENLPSSLQHYFPTVLEENVEFRSNSKALILEAIAFPTLAELFLHWKIGVNAWVTILEKLKHVQEVFSSVLPAVDGSASWLYSQKLANRWNILVNSAKGPIKYWIDNAITINGCALPSLSSVYTAIIPELEFLELNCSLELIHGDFCFNNILCDPITTTIKLIDPRGEMPAVDSHQRGVGDRRYDLIKLNHSIEGLYDSTVNNLFTLNFSGQNVASLSIYKPFYRDFIKKTFQEMLLMNCDSHERRCLTASLFLSMLPLHADDLERQFALAATGSLLLEDKLSLIL